jgi:hypothetical protein
VTWVKLGDEFFDQCADAGLSDAAVRTHAEAVAWLYRLDRDDVTELSISKGLVLRFAAACAASIPWLWRGADRDSA